MHELGITQNVLNIALAEAGRHDAKRIRTIRLVVDDLSGIESDSLSFCFQVMSRGTIAEGARLEIEREKAGVKCESCGTTWTPSHDSVSCPGCGQIAAGMLGAQELRVVSLEMDC